MRRRIVSSISDGRTVGQDTTDDLAPLPEVAIGLNTNEVQVLSRSGADWTPVETHSEVMLSCCVKCNATLH
jgi:hypothetical protein